jgi:hypothetical protein
VRRRIALVVRAAAIFLRVSADLLDNIAKRIDGDNRLVAPVRVKREVTLESPSWGTVEPRTKMSQFPVRAMWKDTYEKLTAAPAQPEMRQVPGTSMVDYQLTKHIEDLLNPLTDATSNTSTAPSARPSSPPPGRPSSVSEVARLTSPGVEYAPKSRERTDVRPADQAGPAPRQGPRR